MSAQRTVYRPIFLTKAGELNAVGTLDAQALQRFAPIFAVHPTAGRKTPEEHLDDVSRSPQVTAAAEVHRRHGAGVCHGSRGMTTRSCPISRR